MTGFSRATVEAAISRANNICECGGPGCTITPSQAHHRRPRGAGGSRRADTNTLANLLLVCEPCHRYIESHRRWAYGRGFLLRQTDDPALVPVRREL